MRYTTDDGEGGRAIRHDHRLLCARLTQLLHGSSRKVWRHMNEEAFFPILRFARFAAQPDAVLRLEEGAFLLTEIVKSPVACGRYRRQLDSLAAEVWAELGPATRLLSPSQRGRRHTAEHALEAMRNVLAIRHGFTGAPDHEYYNLRNSLLTETLDHHVGLPITLSVVYLAVAQRLSLPVVGVNLPTHFMVKWPLSADEGHDLYLDAFHRGALLDETALRAFMLVRLAQHPLSDERNGDNEDNEDNEDDDEESTTYTSTHTMSDRAQGIHFDPEWTRPVGARDILTRMFNNLKFIYLHRGDLPLALATVDRLMALRPDLPQELRDRGLLRLALGEPYLGFADLASYLERAPNAPEAARLRRRLNAMRLMRAQLN